MTYLAAFVIGLVAYGFRLWARGSMLTPDGHRYLYDRSETPFSLRPLLPLVLRSKVEAWQVVSGLSLVLSCVALAWFLSVSGLESWRVIFGVVMFVGLPGVWALGVKYPVLVDQFAMLLILTAAACIKCGLWWAALPILLIAAFTKETTPVWCAIFSWSLWPLAFLVIPAVLMLRAKQRKPLKLTIDQSRKVHEAAWFSGALMVAPWGMTAIFAPFAVSLPLLVAVAVAYGSLLLANDLTRIYQWAAPAVILAAATAVPMEFAWAAGLFHLFNPWQEVQI